jgi:hypothetical protein
VFTTSFNDNAVRGTLSVNQVNLAAWSAVFSGMVAITNSFNKPVASYVTNRPPTTWANINPVGVDVMNGVDVTNSALWRILNGTNGINVMRANTNLFLSGAFTHIGDILSVPALTEQSPFLNLSVLQQQQQKGISDEVYEWLPQQMMSLLRCPTGPHYVIYCYGQTLKPAQNGLVTSSSTLTSGLNPFKLVTNYQVVAESAVRAVIRVDKHVTATGTNYSAVVESYNPLPPN